MKTYNLPAKVVKIPQSTNPASTFGRFPPGFPADVAQGGGTAGEGRRPEGVQGQGFVAAD